MKLYIFRHSKGTNFGDELNNWLLPRVFPNFFDEDERIIFLGIGSVLSNDHPPQSLKLVFGTGFGGYWPLPELDPTWKVYCVRGPRTAAACGLSAEKVGADAAILANDYRERPARRKSNPIAFIPHFQSVSRGSWKEACRLAGIHFIDPWRPVEQILNEIEASSAIIAEAMHGAIVADALRIPWVPALPLHPSHRSKWLDWADSLKIRLIPRQLFPSSAKECFLSFGKRDSYRLEHATGALRVVSGCADRLFVMGAAARLAYLSRREPTLSSDAAFDQALGRLKGSAAEIKRDFAR